MARRAFTALVLLIGCGGGLGDAPQSAAPPPAASAQPAPHRHLIYLHGKIIEDQGPRPTHPRFGVYEYRQILDTFGAAGFEVSSELRPSGTVPADAAHATALRVRELLAAGVPPEAITVVGFSKGGAIAVLTALELDDPRINYVFMACCGPWLDDLFAAGDRTIKGRMLSIFERSDAVGSCRALFDHASPDSVTAEIETDLGTAHGAFYTPHPAWVGPVVAWANLEQ